MVDLRVLGNECRRTFRSRRWSRGIRRRRRRHSRRWMASGDPRIAIPDHSTRRHRRRLLLIVLLIVLRKHI